jgi:flagellin FlaA/flagellin FlaB
MKEKLKERLTDRGQVGIGTLIVFIAMVLVAAIAAGVLINTAGFLQTKSEQTGQESSAQVSNRMQVVSAFGTVGNSESVTNISLTVMRGSGSDDINLSAATIEWIGPEKAQTLIYKENSSDTDGPGITATTFTVNEIKDSDGSLPVLNTQNDRLEVKMSPDKISSPLDEGEEVKLKLTTQYGAVTLYRVNIPQSLSKESAVTV